ncbi:MAG: hypothetical protein ACKO43_06225 [Alphaproteobacteria bacterium]
MGASIQAVIEEIQHNIISSYGQYMQSSNTGEKTFEGFLGYASGKFFLPWAEPYKDSLKGQEQPTIDGFRDFCSREPLAKFPMREVG